MQRIIKKTLVAAAAVTTMFVASGGIATAQPKGAKEAAAPAEKSTSIEEQIEAGLTEQDRQVLVWARESADKTAKAIESWIASNKVSDKKMFSFLYFPIANTDPPKFSTAYDKLADADFPSIQEDYLTRMGAEGRFVVIVDKNGYLPCHNKKYSQPLTGNRHVDLTHNRTKRIFNDITGLNAARNTKPFLLQLYKRDTGELMKDLSVPIMVRGRHWGSIRFGYVNPTPQAK